MTIRTWSMIDWQRPTAEVNQSLTRFNVKILKYDKNFDILWNFWKFWNFLKILIFLKKIKFWNFENFDLF
jgi:hypothetical protein